jgi:pimeloyl-ACP methyl ester carboxylesterase
MICDVELRGVGTVPVSVEDVGDGPAFLLLHGGAGPQSVSGFAGLLAESGPSRVLTPTHPGFSGTVRPNGLDSIAGLARLYAQLVADLDLDSVTVVGNSIGGWIAAEMAAPNNAHVGAVALVGAAGAFVADDPIADFFALTPDEVVNLSYFEPDRHRIDFAAMPDAQKALMAANRAVLGTYAGTAMADPSLLGRLSTVTVPVLVVWGVADRIIPLAHGRAYAAAIPNARLHIIEGAGHMPQLERPDELASVLTRFAAAANGASRA